MESLMASRDALHRVAAHIVARSRVDAEGRFSLRVTPGGLGTPDHGPTKGRVRISGDHLVVEADVAGAPSAKSIPIKGATLRQLAEFAGVDLARPLDVGSDTPPLDDIDAPIDLDSGAARTIASWFGEVAAILDAVLAAMPASAAATLPRLWPEHFDVAVEAQARPDRRVNLGGSPGDGFLDEPYLYVGPWTSDRPGAPEFWNASFGASRTRGDLADGDVIVSGAGFLLEGFRRLA